MQRWTHKWSCYKQIRRQCFHSAFPKFAFQSTDQNSFSFKWTTPLYEDIKTQIKHLNYNSVKSVCSLAADRRLETYLVILTLYVGVKLFLWTTRAEYYPNKNRTWCNIIGGWETPQWQPNPTKWKQIFLGTENLYGEKIGVYCQGRYIVQKKFTRNILHWVLSSTNKRREIKWFCSHLEKDTKSKSPASLMSAFCPKQNLYNFVIKWRHQTTLCCSFWIMNV